MWASLLLTVLISNGDGHTLVAVRPTETQMPNLFDNLPHEMPAEIVEALLQTPSFRVERIVSHAHASPEGFWYDQDDHEWVVVLRGGARLLFADADEPLEMAPGDYVHIPAHRRHRVEWTTPDEPTVWLAIYYNGSS